MKTCELISVDELVSTVISRKYFDEGESSPEDIWNRLADSFSEMEKRFMNPLSRDEIYKYLEDYRYIVMGGSVQSALGTDKLQSLSNCFVIGGEYAQDSFNGENALQGQMKNIFKRRGGVGLDISFLRPKNAKVSNAAGSSTGSVSFAQSFSNTTGMVGQNNRRGALMISLSISHPDAIDFILSKQVEGAISNANLSLRVTDKFMEAVETNSDYLLRFPVDMDVSDKKLKDFPMDVLTEVGTNQYVMRVNAGAVFKTLTDAAWSSADPGCLFWDTIIRESNGDHLGKFKTSSTNPCGEIPLSPYDSCRLLAINLSNVVINPWTSNAKIDMALLADICQKITRLGDDLVEAELNQILKITAKVESENDPINAPEIELLRRLYTEGRRSRRLGVGIMGLADMYAMLGWTYANDKTNVMTEKLMEFIATRVYATSMKLAEERGSFPEWEPHTSGYIDRLEIASGLKISTVGRRNLSLLTIAPTGTISLVAGCSSGLEPVFNIYFDRRVKSNTDEGEIGPDGYRYVTYPVFHPGFIDWYSVAKKHCSFEEAYLELSTMDKSKLDKLIKSSPYEGSLSHQIDFKSKVKLQSYLQKWIDHSISVTINLPSTATKELVYDLYISAWKSGCKGITIYRDGSKQGILTNKTTKAAVVRSRPTDLKSKVYRFKVGKTPWTAIIGLSEDRPYEIFAWGSDVFEDVPKEVSSGIIRKRKVAGDEYSHYDFIYDGGIVEDISDIYQREYWVISKLISGFLRNNIPVSDVIRSVQRLKWSVEGMGTWSRGIIGALKEYVKDGESGGELCPDCKEPLVYISGCKQCLNCGYGKCSL